MVQLSKRFPFLEWGILVSETQAGFHRFPSDDWMRRFARVVEDNPNMNVCLHFCGRWVRQIAVGNWIAPILGIRFLKNHVRRIQLNFHGDHHNFSDRGIDELKDTAERNRWQVICQIDGVNDQIVNKLLDKGVDAVPLFDKSGGAGVVPPEWPKQPMVYAGYAGGLGPSNVLQELGKIANRTNPKRPFWIDMETKLYSNKYFSFQRCKDVLLSCESLIKTK